MAVRSDVDVTLLGASEVTLLGVTYKLDRDSGGLFCSECCWDRDDMVSDPEWHAQHHAETGL